MTNYKLLFLKKGNHLFLNSKKHITFGLSCSQEECTTLIKYHPKGIPHSNLLDQKR